MLFQQDYAFGDMTWPDEWPTGSAYPDYFAIGDVYTNAYEGSASLTDIRLYGLATATDAPTTASPVMSTTTTDAPPTTSPVIPTVDSSSTTSPVVPGTDAPTAPPVMPGEDTEPPTVTSGGESARTVLSVAVIGWWLLALY